VVRILVVDDHPLFRDGFAHMVRELRPEWNLTFSASAPDALAALSQIAPNLVIADVGLPGDDGFSLLEAIAAVSSIPVILISGRDDAAVSMRARSSGAHGFVAKTELPDQIAATIDAVLSGARIFGERSSVIDLPVLSRRQTEILMLVAQGYGNREIRHRLSIAERTVRAHLTELFQLLKVSSRMQATIRARELGLIE
jgi:DNA-binding NarL/FixJ family response regulator